MTKLISKSNELGQMKWVCNSSDITETTTGNVTYVTLDIGANHGDKLTCIETAKEYLYDAVSGKWARPKD